MWLDFGKILSYGALMNYVIAERGIGKSYGAKKYIVNHFKKKHKQSVYLRRYKSELQEALMKKSQPIFFDQVKKEFPNVKYSVITPFLEQEKNWNEQKQTQYIQIINNADLLKLIGSIF